MAQSGYQPPDILERAQEYYKNTGVEVNVFFPEYEERYGKITASAVSEKPEYDVILIDLVWVMDFIKNGYIDPLPERLASKVKEGMVPEIYSSFKYGNKIWAVPFQADFQLLYYNSRILEKAGFTAPPGTLEELVRMSEVIKSRELLLYPIFDSWNRQEVLVCEFAWLTGAFGGRLNGKDGRININTPQALEALNFMKGLLDKRLINPYSLHSDEIFSSEVFLSEDCVFTTNWTFLLEQARKTGLPVKDHWKAALIPVSETVKGRAAGNTASISGYEGLGVMSNSGNKDSAWAFIEFLSSPDFQQKHLDYMSVWKDVWSNSQTEKTDPYIKLKEQQIRGVVNRPVAVNYKKISGIIQNWIYKTLSGDISPDEALRTAQREIRENCKLK